MNELQMNVAALSDVGLNNLKTTLVDQRWNVKSVAQYMDAMRGGTVRASAVLSGQTADATVKIREFFEQTFAGLANPAGSFDVPLPALVGSGAKG